MAVTLYRQEQSSALSESQSWSGTPSDQSRRGPYFLRYSHVDGTRPWEPVGDDLDAAIDAQKRKQAYFEALEANVPVIQDRNEIGRRKITDVVFQWFVELALLQRFLAENSAVLGPPPHRETKRGNFTSVFSETPHHRLTSSIAATP